MNNKDNCNFPSKDESEDLLVIPSQARYGLDELVFPPSIPPEVLKAMKKAKSEAFQKYTGVDSLGVWWRNATARERIRIIFVVIKFNISYLFCCRY